MVPETKFNIIWHKCIRLVFICYCWKKNCSECRCTQKKSAGVPMCDVIIVQWINNKELMGCDIFMTCKLLACLTVMFFVQLLWNLTPTSNNILMRLASFLLTSSESLKITPELAIFGLDNLNAATKTFRDCNTGQ